MQIILLRGPSGSGKSTWYKNFTASPLENAPIGVLSADQFFTNSAGEYKFDRALIGKAHARCLSWFTKYVTDDVITGPLKTLHLTLVVDNTNCSIAEIAPYIALGMAYGHVVRVIDIIGTPLEVCAARNTHGVPLDAIVAQYVAMLQANKDWPSYWPERETIVSTQTA